MTVSSGASARNSLRCSATTNTDASCTLPQRTYAVKRFWSRRKSSSWLNGSAGFTQPSAPASARQTAPTRQERRETAIRSPPAPAAPRGARRTGDRKGLSVGPPAGLEPRAPGSYVAPEGIPIALYLGIDVGGTKTAFALGD